MAEETTPAVSPTGQPWIPTKAVPYLLGLAALCAALVACDEVRVLPIALAPVLPWAKFIGTMLALAGIASPGLRRAAPLVLLLVAVSMLPACANDPCRILSAKQIAVALRAADDAEARLKAGEVDEATAVYMLEAHAADAKMGFPTYRECMP